MCLQHFYQNTPYGWRPIQYRHGYFHYHIFYLGVASNNEHRIWQAHWLDLVRINLCVKKSKQFNCSRIMYGHFRKVMTEERTEDGRTDRRTHNSIIRHTPNFDLTFGRSNFLRVVQFAWRTSRLKEAVRVHPGHRNRWLPSASVAVG